MSRKIGFLQRWMFIIDKINACPYIKLRELEDAVANELTIYDGVKEIGGNVRTIERDIKEIRESSSMDISIVYSYSRRGYYIPKDEKSISRLDRLFELSSLLSFSSLKDIVFGEERKSRGLEHRFSLITAIRKGVEIEMDYRKFKREEPSRLTRRLQPYALREFRNRWYLLAREPDRQSGHEGNIKIWGLDRMENLRITNRKFDKDENIDLKSIFEECFGIFADPQIKAERVVLSFSPLSGRYIDSLPLHESQKVLVDNEEEFRIELTIKITQDFIMELLSYSQTVRVIEPLSLRDRLLEIHKQALSLL